MAGGGLSELLKAPVARHPDAGFVRKGRREILSVNPLGGTIHSDASTAGIGRIAGEGMFELGDGRG
ncbi:MAG: hypothetical protein NVS3B12_05180 [Acidimicrobiales bacterium]